MSRRTTAQSVAAPVLYALLAFVLVGALLPTALRPPTPPPPTSAEFSPDAPPDDQVLVSEFSRGTSATAGRGTTVVGDAGPGAAPVAPAVVRPRRGTCFGSPPRQTESLYSASCAPAWHGENGGATAKGVTPSEIRVGIAIGDTAADYEGPLREPWDGQSDTEVDLRTWQTYFNTRYEFFGRRIRVHLVKLNLTDDPAAARAAVAGADDQWPLFGFIGASTQYPAIQESIRRRIITFDGAAENPHAAYERFHPYFYSFRMDADKIVRLHTEIMCKQLAGRPPEFNERLDTTFDYGKPRRFGLILYEDQVRSGSEEMINAGLAKCGERLAITVKHNLYDNQQSIAAAVTRMRAEGVTTVLLGGDAVTPVSFTNEAQNSGYFPEWWNFGAGGMESNSTSRLYNPAQWRHALGAFYTEIPRPSGYSDCDVAYKTVNPDEGAGACGTFRDLQQFANGIQGAGPKLDPLTFFAGLQKVPCRAPQPRWSIGGCYGPDDFTYPDYQSLIWWDPAGDDPQSSSDGAYKHMFGGRRYTLGEIPQTPLPWFRDGVTTPEDPVQHG